MPDYPSTAIVRPTPVVAINAEALTSAHCLQSNDEDANIEKRDSRSLYCRICHEDSSHEELIDPCECSGTLAMIHASCLEKWLSTSNTECCEICKHDYFIQRREKTCLKSLWQWWRSRSGYGARGIAGDALCLVVLTPLCVTATYLCGIGATVYTRLGFWEGTGLAIICVLLIATYCLWLTVTLRFHCKSWRDWRVKNPEVKLLVKHRSDEHRIDATMIKMMNHSNGNKVSRSVLVESVPRLSLFASWFGMHVNTNDPFFAVQQTSFV